VRLEYYEHWNLLTNQPSHPLDKGAVREKHEELEPYVVTVWDNGRIRHVIKMKFNLCHCSVTHYQHGERIMDEAYQIHEEQLFLREKVLWRTEGAKRVEYLYELNGEFYKQRTDQQDKLIDEVRGVTEVSSHFKDMVQFDQYGSILPI
jgi:hypothetical protein